MSSTADEAVVADSRDSSVAESSNDIASTIWQKVKSFLPDMSNLYLQPLDPSSDMTLSDRLSLIFQSTRPVGEFLDLSKLNLPPVGHVATRVSHNVETYLYNYMVLVCIHLVLFSLVHFGSVLVALGWAALVWFLYIANKGEIDVAGKVSIDSNGKLLIAAATALIALVLGNVSTLIISLCVFVVIVVGIHAILREDTGDE